MKRITVTLTEDQAEEVVFFLGSAAEKARWVNASQKYREQGKIIAAFRQRIVNVISKELAKAKI